MLLNEKIRADVSEFAHGPLHISSAMQFMLYTMNIPSIYCRKILKDNQINVHCNDNNYIGFHATNFSKAMLNVMITKCSDIIRILILVNLTVK